MNSAVSVPTTPLVRGHLKPLDGVRGLAILMVLMTHGFVANTDGHGAVGRLVGNVFEYGIFGVDLFFVLSGFLITGILFDSVNGPGFFANFYARRVLRIFPLYYGVLIALFLVTPVLHLRWGGMGWLMLGYLQNLRPDEIRNFSPGSGIGLNHFWSLAVEEQFYLVWPAVIFFVRGWRSLLWTTLAVSAGALILRLALIGMGVGHLPIHVTTITRADSLLLGGALSLLYRSAYWPRVLKVAPFGFFAAAAVVLVSIGMVGHEFSARVLTMPERVWIDGFRYTVLALGSTCLIAWALSPGSVCARVFEWRWVGFFGKYSYGIYVLHMVFLAVLVGRLRVVILQATQSKMAAVAGAGLITLSLAVGAAYVCFHLYEKPFLRLKRFFEYDRTETRVSRRSADRRRLIGANLINS